MEYEYDILIMKTLQKLNQLTWLETANSVITPSDILTGTNSMSIQNETQDTATWI